MKALQTTAFRVRRKSSSGDRPEMNPLLFTVWWGDWLIRNVAIHNSVIFPFLFHLLFFFIYLWLIIILLFISFISFSIHLIFRHIYFHFHLPSLILPFTPHHFPTIPSYSLLHRSLPVSTQRLSLTPGGDLDAREAGRERLVGGASGHRWAGLQGFLVVHGSLGRWGQHPAHAHAHGRSQLSGLLLTRWSLGAQAGVDAPLVAFL